MIMSKEAQIVKAEISDLRLFWSMELVAFCGINGILETIFSTFLGKGFRCVSLFIAASFGVMEKIFKQAKKQANALTAINEAALSNMMGTLSELPIIGMQ